MKFLSFLVCLLPAFVSFSQNAVVANRKSQPFYMGFANELIVAAEGYKFKDLEVAVDMGKVVKENERFIYYADSSGKATFTLYKFVKGVRVKIASFIYPVKTVYPPSVDLSIGSGNGEKIYKLRLEAQQGVACYYDWSEWGIACLEGVKPVLQSYRLIIMRKDQLVYSTEIKGAAFTDEVQTVFKTLENGDKIYLVDVKVRSWEGERLMAKPFQLEVITNSDDTASGY